MSEIPSGYDLFAVVDGTTSIDLDPIFPGAGIVRSDGVALDHDRFGNATTGLQRLTDLPDGQSGVVMIEWVLEHSVSVKPVPLEPFGVGPGFGDYHTIINRGGIVASLPNTDGWISPSLGAMGIRRYGGTGGGSFELLVNINPLVVLTVVGGSVASLDGPDVLRVLDATGLLNPVTCVNGSWSSVAPQSVNRAGFALSARSFVAGADPTGKSTLLTSLVSGSASATRAIATATF